MSRSGHQAEALGADNGRSPAVYADLLVKVREVVAHGLFGDAQLPRDLCIAGAFAQQAKGSAFALAQGSKHFSRFGWGRRVRGLAGEAADRIAEFRPGRLVFQQDGVARRSSEGLRVGKEGVSTGRSRGGQ